jgi:hypothetical protein
MDRLRFRQVLLDPRNALRQHLNTLEAEINRKRGELTEAYASTSKTGFLAEVFRKSPGDIERMEKELNSLENHRGALNNALHPPINEHTFPQVDEAITLLLRDMVAVLTRLEDLQYWKDVSGKAQSKVDLFFTQVAAITSEYNSQEPLRDLCRMAISLEQLQRKRRELMSGEIASWDSYRVAIEMQKRQRDLDDLPQEFKGQDASGAQFLHTLTPFLEQRRFLQDILYELQAAGKRQQPGEDDVKRAIDEIRKLISTQVGVKVACEEMKSQ